MTNYAEMETRSAWLWTDFGSSYASKIIPQNILDQLPRYVRGAKKGKIKDFKIVWTKVEKGGWAGGARGVENRVGKVIHAKLVQQEWKSEPYVLAEYHPTNDGSWELTYRSSGYHGYELMSKWEQ